jgi:hypothetical protein
MRRSASEIIRNLERRIARLERKVASKVSLKDVVSELEKTTGKSKRDIQDDIFDHLEMLFDNYADMLDDEYEDLLKSNRDLMDLAKKGILGKTFDEQEDKSLNQRDAEAFLNGIMPDESLKDLVKYFKEEVLF